MTSKNPALSMVFVVVKEPPRFKKRKLACCMGSTRVKSRRCSNTESEFNADVNVARHLHDLGKLHGFLGGGL